MALDVVGIGELLWDVFPTGRRLGGAPANFAYHCAGLGCRARVVSRVGDDPLGRETLARLSGLGVDVSLVQVDAGRPTGTVGVQLSPTGQPTYSIHEDVAWDALADPGPVTADALCFGTLACRGEGNRGVLLRLLERARPGCLRVFDVNLRDPYRSPALLRELAGRCDVLKLNEDELPQVAAALGVPAVPQALRAKLGLRLLALTLGARGSLLCTARERLELPALPVRVVDTVGAGDAFTAALVTGMLKGEDLATVHRRATALSAYVCERAGAMPDLAGFHGWAES